MIQNEIIYVFEEQDERLIKIFDLMNYISWKVYNAQHQNSYNIND